MLPLSTTNNRVNVVVARSSVAVFVVMVDTLVAIIIFVASDVAVVSARVYCGLLSSLVSLVVSLVVVVTSVAHRCRRPRCCCGRSLLSWSLVVVVARSCDTAVVMVARRRRCEVL